MTWLYQSARSLESQLWIRCSAVVTPGGFS
ncbi:hypothetical protein J2S55_005264 [Streptosporangium brasiliense]|uniref:Uncharacterized protein n=1 Tax=Streptosporangium brasiliense TaxID=47480 RepID=A0ABT9R9S2_9ACTN|nr:hypothetical protein [Streptosporangium brasiliense]